MRFYKIPQLVYNWYKNHINDVNHDLQDFNEHLYVTDGAFYEPNEEIQGVRRLYSGSDLIGDAYVPQISMDSVAKNNIGGIKNGTTLLNIIKETKGSISSILDKIIFPNYAPVFYPPRFDAVQKTNKQYFFVGESLPEVDITNITTAHTESSIAGECEVLHEVVLGKNMLLSDEIFTSPGIVSVEYYAKCKAGSPTIGEGVDNTVKDSNGNPTRYCADEPYVLMSETSKLSMSHTIVKNEKIVLSAVDKANPIQFVYYVSLPIYQGLLTGDNITIISQCNAEDSYKAIADYAIISLPRQSDAIILVPHGYNITELYMEAHNGTYSNYNMKDNITLKGYYNIVDDQITEVSVDEATTDAYMFAPKCIGDKASYKIKINK